MEIQYSTDQHITPGQFRDLLVRSTLAERRPVDDLQALYAMLENADLLITAWHEDELVGIARSLTDFHYCCYLSDLAVDRAYQRRGIGINLMAATQAKLEPGCMLILLAAPAAVDYYPHLGFTRHPSAWVLGAGEKINRTRE
jgi:GNAT superfamily N-acetyltransferase